MNKFLLNCQKLSSGFLFKNPENETNKCDKMTNAKITTGIKIAMGSYNKMENPTIIPILNSNVLGCVWSYNLFSLTKIQIIKAFAIKPELIASQKGNKAVKTTKVKAGK